MFIKKYFTVDPIPLWKRDDPWAAGPPEKFHLCIAPANPWPLDIPVISTYYPGVKCLTDSIKPTGNKFSLVTTNSAIKIKIIKILNLSFGGKLFFK